ncbi:MAG: glycosyltransferase [Fusobacteriaceae bacterium]
MTTLSTENYLKGVLALKVQLNKNNTKYPLVVLLNQKITEKTVDILKKSEIIVKYIESKIVLDKKLIKSNQDKKFSHWNNTFDKLYIFECIEYKKLIYIDSDMLILKNLDYLFEANHMSATIAGKSYPGNENFKGLNSGFMIVVPENGLTNKMINLIPKVIKKKLNVGDQDIIQEYYKNWNQTTLELNEKYNVFLSYLDFFIKNEIVDEKELAIVHFIGSKKPWMSNNFLKKIKLLLTFKTKAYIYLKRYEKILNEINL